MSQSSEDSEKKEDQSQKEEDKKKVQQPPATAQQEKAEVKPATPPRPPTAAPPTSPIARQTPPAPPRIAPPTPPRAATPLPPTVAARPVGPQAAPTAAPRPTAASPAMPTKPTIPPKVRESKQEISRRNFLKGLAILGGLVAVGQFVQLAPFLQGSVGISSATTQQILDVKTGATIKTSDIAVNDSRIFVYPRTGNPNIDDDTFSQCVVIHLPKGFTAPSNLSVKDPISGDTFIAFSRVCVHLWCLWSYVPADNRMECPCHGSQYVPGIGPPYNNEPGIAVAGPASLQTPPNNQLPIITLQAAADGTLSATGILGQVGCGQKC